LIYVCDYISISPILLGKTFPTNQIFMLKFDRQFCEEKKIKFDKKNKKDVQGEQEQYLHDLY